MNGRSTLRTRAVLAAALSLILSGLAAASPGAAEAGGLASLPLALPLQGPTPTATAGPYEGVGPCDSTGSRKVSPRVVEEGQAVSVEVTYQYDCREGGTRQVDILYVIENNGMLKLVGDQPGTALRDNLVTGLQDLALSIDYRNGSRFGMIWAGCNWQGIVPIGAGKDHWDGWLRQISAIRGQVPGGINFGSAMRAASGDINNLAKEKPDGIPPGVMLIVDAGSPECIGVPPTQDDASVADACNAAKAEQNIVILVALAASQGRLNGCNSRGWYFRSSSDAGQDLPAIFTQIKDQLLSGKRPQTTAYNDYLQSAYFQYQDLSGVPRDPDRVIFGTDLSWEENVSRTNPKASFRYTYKVDTLPGSGGVITPITIDPGSDFMFYYSDGTSDRLLTSNETVCIYRPGQRDRDCGAFEAGMTATAVAAAQTATARAAPIETPTPTPDAGPPSATPTDEPPATDTPDPGAETPTATDEPEPSETPTPEVDPTDPPDGFAIHLPFAIHAHALP